MSFLATTDRLFPEMGRAQLLARVDPELSHRIREQKILVGGWYPVAWYRDLHAGLQQVTGSGADLSFQIGYENTRADFTGKGIYRFVAKSLGPGNVLTIGARIFNFYWRPAKMQIKRMGEHRNQARGKWSGCRGFDENVWLDLFGGVQAVLELAGVRDVELETLDASEDLSTMLMEARWQVS